MSLLISFSIFSQFLPTFCLGHWLGHVFKAWGSPVDRIQTPFFTPFHQSYLSLDSLTHRKSKNWAISTFINLTCISECIFMILLWCLTMKRVLKQVLFQHKELSWRRHLYCSTVWSRVIPSKIPEWIEVCCILGWRNFI